MARTVSIARALHDVGLAAWFGGSLMGAVGLEAAAASRDDPSEADAVDAAGWARWRPVNGAAVAAHLAGGTVLTLANRRRIRHQRGVFALSAVKAALTFGAVAATACGEVLDRRARDATSGAADRFPGPRRGARWRGPT